MKFWGTRGSIPTPGHATRRFGGNTSCVEVRVDGQLFICDGGTGLRELGLELVARSAGTPIEAHLLFSHTHWDHIQGFPFFSPAYVASTALYVYDVEPHDDRVHRLLRGQMRHDYFPVSFSDLGASIHSANLDGGSKTIAGVRVSAFEQRHPGRSFAYSLEREGKKVVYATDNELDMLVAAPEAIARYPDARRLCPPEFVRFAAGADLLIADGQYTDEEYPQKVGWGHSRATTLVDLALAAGVRQLAIFHHDPMHADDEIDAIVMQCRARADRFGGKLVVFAAREGMELRL